MSTAYVLLPVSKPDQTSFAVSMVKYLWALCGGMVVHALVFSLGNFIAGQRDMQRVLPKQEKSEFVMVHQAPVTAPPPTETLPQTQVAEAVAPVPATKPVKRERSNPVEKTKVSPKEIPAVPDEDAAPSFVDIGVMGSADIGITGPGGGAFSVATGNSGTGAAIGRSGVVSGKALKGGPLRAAQPTTTPLAVASLRDLSQKARPETSHNKRLKAQYPQELRERGIAGSILAVLTVLENGTVASVDIVRASDDGFVTEAIKVLRRFLFKPALNKRGRPVPSRVTLTYRFTLD